MGLILQNQLQSVCYPQEKQIQHEESNTYDLISGLITIHEYF